MLSHKLNTEVISMFSVVNQFLKIVFTGTKVKKKKKKKEKKERKKNTLAKQNVH